MIELSKMTIPVKGKQFAIYSLQRINSLGGAGGEGREREKGGNKHGSVTAAERALDLHGKDVPGNLRES